MAILVKIFLAREFIIYYLSANTPILHLQSIHDQKVSHHLQQIKELEIRLINEKDEALSKVSTLEQKLVEHGTNHAKLDNKLLVAYNEV